MIEQRSVAADLINSVIKRDCSALYKLLHQCHHSAPPLIIRRRNSSGESSSHRHSGAVVTSHTILSQQKHGQRRVAHLNDTVRPRINGDQATTELRDEL